MHLTPRAFINLSMTAYAGSPAPISLGLFYLEEEQRIVVLACLDLRRDPEAIASMVTARRNQ